ncbi:MAG: DUF4143 domain-containing protein [Deltaproteobacteria bacterium]|nr:DUF4143 domain-containing protein [Deltaproteobacteria bacterium]
MGYFSYFYDTGLAAYLLGIQDASQLQTHYCKGALFESFIICEIIKHKFNRGKENNCYFWGRQSPASGQSRCNPMERSGQIILLKNFDFSVVSVKFKNKRIMKHMKHFLRNLGFNVHEVFFRYALQS